MQVGNNSDTMRVVLSFITWPVKETKFLVTKFQIFVYLSKFRIYVPDLSKILDQLVVEMYWRKIVGYKNSAPLHHSNWFPCTMWIYKSFHFHPRSFRDQSVTRAWSPCCCTFCCCVEMERIRGTAKYDLKFVA